MIPSKSTKHPVRHKLRQSIKQKTALPTSLIQVNARGSHSSSQATCFVFVSFTDSCWDTFALLLCSRDGKFKILLLLNLRDMKNANAGMGPGGKLFKTGIRMLFCK